MENRVVVAVKAAILGPSGRYLAVQRSAQDDIGAERWEFPGGKLEFGETLEAAVAREVQEETGLAVEIDRLLYASTFWTQPARQVVLLTYLARSQSETVALSSEHTAYRWLPPEALSGWLDASICQDINRYGIWETLQAARKDDMDPPDNWEGPMP